MPDSFAPFNLQIRFNYELPFEASNLSFAIFHLNATKLFCQATATLNPILGFSAQYQAFIFQF